MEDYTCASRERTGALVISVKMTKGSRGKVELGGGEKEIRAGERERETESKDSRRSDVIQHWRI